MTKFKVKEIIKERVHLNAEMLFGNRRWVIDDRGKLVERYGIGHVGDTDVVRTVCGQA